jgi:hypothetical protein|tara:strand:+ start:85 stop:855 length:771 start_codon:yes stop_codon:yes gene_type:complete
MIDIVIQGPYTDFTDEVIESYLNIEKVQNIIVSCWDTDKKEEYVSDRVKFVRNDEYPPYSGVLNINMQLITSLNGVKASNADYVMKVRSDQKVNLQGMNNMFDYFLEDKQKGKIYICGNLYTYLFHPRDWIFMGYKEDMINFFDIPFEVNEICEKKGVDRYNCSMFFHLFTRPETYLGAYYCARFDDRVAEMVKDHKKYLYDRSPEWNYSKQVSDEVMRKYFKSFPREGIDLIWPKNNIYKLPYDCTNEEWHEEGF